MRLKAKIVVDCEDGREPVSHEIWRDFSRADVQEFLYPEVPIGSDLWEWKQFDGQLRRHKDFVKMISFDIASALGRALGDNSTTAKGPDYEESVCLPRRTA